MNSKGTVFAELLLGGAALSYWATGPRVTIVIRWIIPSNRTQHNHKQVDHIIIIIN